MLDFLRATTTIFTTHLALSLRSVRFLLSALLALAPIALALVVSVAIGSVEPVPVPEMTWMLIVQGVTPLLALMFGSAVISEEVSDRTITYLFTRPIPRSSVFIGRWLANLAIVSGLLAISCFGTVFMLRSHLQDSTYFEFAWALTETVVIGAATYSALFAGLGALLKHPIIIGLAYVFCFEFLLVNAPIPGNTQHLSLQFHLRSMIVNSGVADWAEVAVFRNNHFIERADAMGVHLTVLALSLIFGSLLIHRRQFELTA